MDYGIRISKKDYDVITGVYREGKMESSKESKINHVLWNLALPYIVGARKQLNRYQEEVAKLEKEPISTAIECMHEISALFEDLSTIGNYVKRSGANHRLHSLWLDIRNHIRHDFREGFDNRESKNREVDRAKRAERLKIDSYLHTSIGFDVDSIKIGGVIIKLKEIDEYINWAESELETTFNEAQDNGYVRFEEIRRLSLQSYSDSNIFKKTIKWILILSASFIATIIIIYGVLFLLIAGVHCKIYEFVGRLSDPCFSLDYPSKGPSYDVRNDRVCYTDKETVFACTAGWGEPALVITRTLKKADPKTFTIIDNYHAKDKNHVYYWGEAQLIK